MVSAVPLVFTALIAASIMMIGCFYLASPGQISKSFGLKPPAQDADTLAWLRLKGIRDIASGLVLLSVMLASDKRLAGVVLLVFALIPFGDMTNILMSGGSKQRALSVHGLTCAVMVVVGLCLLAAGK